MNKKLIIISGPTAIGKTDISIKLAKQINGEIISADSMQIYKFMDIGSAKISKDEMDGIKHHMIDIIEPDKEFSVSEYKDRAEKIIDSIIKSGKIPIMAGGTGLYIDSIICNLTFTEGNKDMEYRLYLENLAREKGKDFVHRMLKDIDIKSYENIHPNNLKRVIRALEVYKLTGKPFSSYDAGNKIYDIPYDLCYYVLIMNRDSLYDRINKRVDMMIDKGLIEEVKYLKSLGYTADMQSMQGIGYKEILYYLDGKITLEKAIDMIKQGSRNYAKRQLTWFRKDPRVKYINKDEFQNESEILKNILFDLNNSGL